MEKRILKWITGVLGVLTAVSCICLYYFPEVKEAMAFAQEETKEPETPKQEIQVEIETEPEQGQEDDTTDKEQLNIELPQGIDGSNVTIINDYLNQTLVVRFDKGVEDYAQNHRVYGSSNHISSIAYHKDGERGVLNIYLDKVCEYSYYYKKGYLCLELINPHDIYDKVVVIDAGHGGKAPGAVEKGVQEKGLNLAVLKELKALLDQEKNIKVYYTRTDDTNPSLQQRVGLANKANADLFISIHHNASSSGTFDAKRGTLILYNHKDKSEHSSLRLANICLDNVVASTGGYRMGLLQGNYVHIVDNSKVPMVLVEVGYMTNLQELEEIQKPEYQKKVAQGIYNSIMQAFEEGY